jgi:hypothetical protein
MNIFFIYFCLKNWRKFIKLAQETNTVSYERRLTSAMEGNGYENEERKKYRAKKINVVDKFYVPALKDDN